MYFILVSYLLRCQFSIFWKLFCSQKQKNGIENAKGFTARLTMSNNLLFQSCLYASNQWVAGRDLQGQLVSYLLLLHFLIPVLAELQHRTIGSFSQPENKSNESQNIKNMHQLQELLNNVRDLMQMQISNADSEMKNIQSKVGWEP